ncbi:MAG: glycosyltransferase family 39 protein, partial [Lysobacterales bacterium]
AVISLFAVDALVGALRDGRLRQWLAFGFSIALGLLCHYRFAVMLPALAWVLVATPAGRCALTGRGPWLAAAVASLGLLPLLWFNYAHQFSGLRFQFVERHPWAWQWQGLWQLPEQLLMASPLLLLLLAWALWRRLAQRPLSGPEQVLVPVAVIVWLLFIGLGFFADGERFRWHWPLPAYLLLLPVLARDIGRLKPAWRLATVATAVLATSTVLLWLVAALVPDRAGVWAAGKRFPANFVGWRESADWLGQTPLPERIVVDNFMLAANLAFYLPDSRERLRVLDDVRNVRHGRATQLAIWAVDEAALATEPSQPGWLVVEETARRFSDRWSWYQDLCRRFSGLELDQVLSLHGDRKRFVRWRYQAYQPQAQCRQLQALPPLGWIEVAAGARHLRRGEPLRVTGWALQPGLGIDEVRVAVDGVPVASGQREHESGWPADHWGEVEDPAGTRLGFQFVLDSTGLAAGRRQVQVSVVRADGRIWPLATQAIDIRP